MTAEWIVWVTRLTTSLYICVCWCETNKFPIAQIEAVGQTKQFGQRFVRQKRREISSVVATEFKLMDWFSTEQTRMDCLKPLSLYVYVGVRVCVHIFCLSLMQNSIKCLLLLSLVISWFVFVFDDDDVGFVHAIETFYSF